MLIKSNEKGITLIGLVVTIIVLLILAAVSIAMLTGENGILTQAKLSKSKTKEGGVREEVELAIQEILLKRRYKEELTTRKISEYLAEKLDGIAIIEVTDEKSGVDLENCKCVLKDNETEVGTDIANYTGGKIEEGEVETGTITNAGKYYMHILVTDKLGNSKEYCSAENCYWSGSTNATGRISAFIGSPYTYNGVGDIDTPGIVITNCYYDKTKFPYNLNSRAGTGLTTENMKKQESYVGGTLKKHGKWEKMDIQN